MVVPNYPEVRDELASLLLESSPHKPACYLVLWFLFAASIVPDVLHLCVLKQNRGKHLLLVANHLLIQSCGTPIMAFSMKMLITIQALSELCLRGLTV